MPASTQPGALTSQLLLQKETRTPDGAGGHVVTWTTEAAPWGRVTQTGGGEQLEGGQDPSRRTFDIRIRRRSGLGAHLRVCWGNTVMAIVSVRVDDEDREFAILECVEQPGATR